jgi:Astacin (Peptidase family M12A)
VVGQSTGNRWTTPQRIPVYFDSSVTIPQKSSIISFLTDIYGWNTISTRVEFAFVSAPENPGITVSVSGVCNSYVGMVGGNQQINLAIDCINRRDVSHEFGHALGMFHEQQRCDRDSYVNIYPTRIPGYSDVNWSTVYCSQMDQPTDYDFISIMHYPSYLYASGYDMTRKDGSPIIVGNGWGPSPKDLATINWRY